MYLHSMKFKFFDKKSRDTNTITRVSIISRDQQLVNKLHRPITKKFQRRKVYSSYQDNNWGITLRHAANKQIQ